MSINSINVSRVINSFATALANEEDATLFPTEAGATGFTFFGDFILPDESQPEGERIQKIILKWVDSAIAENEKLCSEILRCYEFTTPEILFADPEDAKKIARYAIAKKPALEANHEAMTLIVMDPFHADTFTQIIKNRVLWTLSEEELRKFFRFIGKVVAVDLLIGNDDRFVRFTDDREAPLQADPECNSGNIMLNKISVVFDASAQSRIQKFYLIDNSTSLRLKERTHISGEKMGFSALFGGSQSSSSDSSASSSSSETQNDLKILLQDAFANFLRNTDPFKRHVIHSVINEINQINEMHNPDLENGERFRTLLEEEIEKGFIKGRNRLIKHSSKLDNDNIINDNKTDYGIELIRENLNHLKSFLSEGS